MDITEDIMELFLKERPGRPSPVWSANEVVTYGMLSAAPTKRALKELVGEGRLASVREEYTVVPESLLAGLYDKRANATYYMLPGRLSELEAARDERIREPYWKQARQHILDRYADEVKAEFERLWADRAEES